MQSSLAVATTASSAQPLLARTGRKVLVLEAASEVGGAARTEEFAPGFRVSSIAHLLNRLHPDVVKTLDLEKPRTADYARRLRAVGGAVEGRRRRLSCMAPMARC